jgi:hypothetical protein
MFFQESFKINGSKLILGKWYRLDFKKYENKNYFWIKDWAYYPYFETDNSTTSI